MAGIPDSDNKIVMVCRAQRYCVYGATTEQYPQTYLIFIHTSISTSIPISTASRNVQTIYLNTPSKNCRHYWWGGTIGKAFYQGEKWVLGETISDHHISGQIYYNILKVIYQSSLPLPLDFPVKQTQIQKNNLKREKQKSKNEKAKQKKDNAKNQNIKGQILLTCLAWIQTNNDSGATHESQFAFVVVGDNLKTIKRRQLFNMDYQARIAFDEADFRYHWDSKSEQGQALLYHKSIVLVPNTNQKLSIIRVYYDYRGSVSRLWGPEFASDFSIVNMPSKIKLYRQPLTKNKAFCPFCYEPLIPSIVTIVLYTDSTRRTVDKPYKYCRVCKMPYLSICNQQTVLGNDAPFVQTFMVSDCKNLQEAKQKAMLQSDGKPFAEKAPVQSSGATIQTYTPYKPVKIENNINLSLLPAKTNKIYVFAEKCYCRSCVERYGLNTTESQTALVSTISGKTVPVNVQYCNRCGCYYMNVRTYKDYCNRYGHLLLEIHYTEEFTTGSYDSFRGFAKDSILSRCGYSVKQGIPATTRQKILIYIMESKRATKWQIIDLISGFISLNSYLPRMSGAVDRWSEDLTFVNNYKLGSQPLTSVDTFVQGGTISERYRWM